MRDRADAVRALEEAAAAARAALMTVPAAPAGDGIRERRAQDDRLRDAADLVGSWADAVDALADVVEEGVD
ncbi:MULTISPECIES: hypothetical protein [unclassified Geodermatophilus]